MLRHYLTTRTLWTLLAPAALSLCLHAAPPMPCPAQGTAVVVGLTGQVSVMRGNAVALFQGDKIKRQETIVTGHEGYAKFVVWAPVPPCSSFEVFPDSKVVFHDNPTNTYKDLLNVFIGRVKVFIEHLNGPNYNSVTTPTAVISVRGTVFDVVVEDEDGTTLVTVDEGRVEVMNTTAAGETPILDPGDSIRIYPRQRLHGHVVNHDEILQRAMRAAADTFRALVGHGSGGIGVPGVGGGGTGAQGDHGKNNGGSGTGSSTGSTGPPTGPKPGGGG